MQDGAQLPVEPLEKIVPTKGYYKLLLHNLGNTKHYYWLVKTRNLNEYALYDMHKAKSDLPERAGTLVVLKKVKTLDKGSHLSYELEFFLSLEYDDAVLTGTMDIETLDFNAIEDIFEKKNPELCYDSDSIAMQEQQYNLTLQTLQKTTPRDLLLLDDIFYPEKFTRYSCFLSTKDKENDKQIFLSISGENMFFTQEAIDNALKDEGSECGISECGISECGNSDY